MFCFGYRIGQTQDPMAQDRHSARWGTHWHYSPPKLFHFWQCTLKMMTRWSLSASRDHFSTYPPPLTAVICCFRYLKIPMVYVYPLLNCEFMTEQIIIGQSTLDYWKQDVGTRPQLGVDQSQSHVWGVTHLVCCGFSWACRMQADCSIEQYCQRWALVPFHDQHPFRP